MRRLLSVASFALAAWCAAPATAQVMQTRECATALAHANDLIEAVAARDRAGPIADNAKLCATLRRNLSDMRAAADIMQRCLRGHAQRENVGQLRASAEDVAAVIARRCR